MFWGSYRSAAGMEEAFPFPPHSQRRQTAPVLGPGSFPGTGGRQSRDKTQMPGWKKGSPLSSATLLWLVKIMEIFKSQK